MEELQQRCKLIDQVTSKGFTIVYLDEVMYTKKTFMDRTWSRVNERQTIDLDKLFHGPIACCVAVSAEKGVEHLMTWPKSVNGERFVDFLKKLRRKTHGRRICVYLDNISFHRSEDTKKEMDRLDFKYIFNPSYMPLANPIEECFSVAKHEYRKTKLNALAKNETVDHEKLIKKGFDKVTP